MCGGVRAGAAERPESVIFEGIMNRKGQNLRCPRQESNLRSRLRTRRAGGTQGWRTPCESGGCPVFSGPRPGGEGSPERDGDRDADADLVDRRAGRDPDRECNTELCSLAHGLLLRQHRREVRDATEQYPCPCVPRSCLAGPPHARSTPHGRSRVAVLRSRLGTRRAGSRLRPQEAIRLRIGWGPVSESLPSPRVPSVPATLRG